MKFNTNECVKLVEFYYCGGKSIISAVRGFNTWRRVNNIRCPVATINDVRRIVRKFTTNGTVNANYKGRCGRPNSVVNEDNAFFVLGIMSQPDDGNIPVSVRQCAEISNLSKTSTQRICRKLLKLYPYRILLAQRLSNHDKVVRCESCVLFPQVLPGNLDLFFFSDEATLRTDGVVNRWNCRIWSSSRPANFFQSRCQNAEKVTVWATISAEYLFGPYFSLEQLTAISIA